MRVNVILVFVALVLGLVDAARRRDRLRTSPTTTTPSLIDRQFAFAGQPEGQCQPLQSCNSRILQEALITIIETITESYE